MSTSIVFAGTTYSIPASGETGWSSLSNYLIALAQNTQTNTALKGGTRVVTGDDAFNTATDFALLCNHSGALALTLPAGINGQLFCAVDISSAGAGTNNITVSGGSNINGAATFVLNRNKEAVFFQFNTVANEWKVISLSMPNVTFPFSGTLATLDGAETFTNKTLTAPEIDSPTGIVKADVGLDQVDNTSDATKNAAVATLTNKTLTAPEIDSPTGIVKGDVGLGNVDNTSDSTKNAAAVTLTNKAITSPTINTEADFRAQALVKFHDSTNTHFSAFKAPSALTADKTFTLPDGDGTSNQALSTDGSGTLIWQTVATATNATPSVAGLVSTTAQSFGGLKKFEGGLSSTGTTDSSTSTVTLDNTSSRDIDFTGASDITVKLPTTTILKGETFLIYNSTSKNLTLQSSGANTIDIFNQGHMKVRATQDTPTTAAHWEVLEYDSKYTHTTTFTMNNSGNTSGSQTCQVRRTNDTVTWAMPCVQSATNASDASMSMTTAFPSQYGTQTAAGQGAIAARKKNGSYDNVPCVVRFTSANKCQITVADGGGTWGAGSASGLSENSYDFHVFTYLHSY